MSANLESTVIRRAERLGAFYTALLIRQPRVRGLDLLPAERRGGRCVAQVGLGVGFTQSLDYAAALILTYGPGVIGERDLTGARSRIQAWIDESREAPWDPAAGKEPRAIHEIDTTAFRADFDAVISAVDAAGSRQISELLDGLGVILREKLRAITPRWCMDINGKLAKDRVQVLGTQTAPGSPGYSREESLLLSGWWDWERRPALAPIVRAINDPLLSTLFAHPKGTLVLRALASDPDHGAAEARGIVTAALDALQKFQMGIGADAHWRYPEYIPLVLEGLGLGKVTGLAAYLTAIADGQVHRTAAERAVEIGGFAILALGLIFSGGAAAVAVSAAGVALSGVNLGLAFIADRNRAFAVDAYALESGERQLFTPRFPVATALAAAATTIAAIGFFFSVRGLGRVSPAPPRPGAAQPLGSSGARHPAPSAKPSTSPAASADRRSLRLNGEAQKATGSPYTNEPPRPDLHSPSLSDRFGPSASPRARQFTSSNAQKGAAPGASAERGTIPEPHAERATDGKRGVPARQQVAEEAYKKRAAEAAERERALAAEREVTREAQREQQRQAGEASRRQTERQAEWDAQKAAQRAKGREAARAERAAEGLGRFARMVGKRFREVFGEIRFRGLKRNRPLPELTDAEIRDAFAETPFTPTNHVIERLRNPRTANLGVETLDDLARNLNSCTIEDGGEGLLRLASPDRRLYMLVDPKTNNLVTFRPFGE